MKVSMGDMNVYKEIQPVHKTAEKASRCEKQKDLNFDRVLLSSDSRKIGEKKLSESVVRELKAEIGQKDNRQKIERLKEAVASGTYEIDAGEIAARIMILGGKTDV